MGVEVEKSSNLGKCIDQHNAVEKHVQIANMDVIYSQAQLTIIAAAGSDPYYGLPGVSTRPRRPAKRQKVSDIELVEMRMDEVRQLRSSFWAQRGWTFQEGYLSNRRLLFSDSQVSFACSKICCVESVRQSPRIRDGNSGLFQDIKQVLGMSTRNEDRVARMLEEYVARKMTYDTDILNACRGVLNSICLSHIHGTPLEMDASGKIHARLLWQLAPRKGQSDWTHIPSRRRAGFPSWSWTGWKNHIKFCAAYEMNEVFCTVEVLGVDAQWQSLKEYVDMEDTRREAVQDQPQHLRITAPYMPADFFTFSSFTYMTASLPYSDEENLYLSTHLDDSTGYKQLADVVALAMYYTRGEPRGGRWSDTKLVGLLFKPVGKVYHRVGLIEASYSDYATTMETPPWLLEPELRTLVVK
jgi:hypothetical protein